GDPPPVSSARLSPHHQGCVGWVESARPTTPLWWVSRTRPTLRGFTISVHEPFQRHPRQKRAIDVPLGPGIGTPVFKHFGHVGQNELLGIERRLPEQFAAG